MLPSAGDATSIERAGTRPSRPSSLLPGPCRPPGARAERLRRSDRVPVRERHGGSRRHRRVDLEPVRGRHGRRDRRADRVPGGLRRADGGRDGRAERRAVRQALHVRGRRRRFLYRHTREPGVLRLGRVRGRLAVYCPALPAGWFVQSGSYRLAGGARLEISYRGPRGAHIDLKEGAFCSSSDGCVPDGTDAGTAAFGDRQGALVSVGADSWAISDDAGSTPSWLLSGTGLSEDEFRTIASDLVVVGG